LINPIDIDCFNVTSSLVDDIVVVAVVVVPSSVVNMVSFLFDVVVLVVPR
jgi:hypothetical protein